METFSCPKEGMLKISSVTAVNGREEHCVQVAPPPSEAFVASGKWPACSKQVYLQYFTPYHPLGVVAIANRFALC